MIPAALFYLIFPCALVFFYRIRSLFWLTVLLFKIIAALGMTWLLIHRWEFGDFYLYFVDAKEIASNSGYRPQFFQGYSSTYLFALVFTVLPSSIYGLAILSGTASFFFCYCLLKGLKKIFVVPKSCQFLICFSPIFSMSCAFVGKETWILPALGLFCLKIKDKKSYIFDIVIGLWIGLFRLYQSIFYFAAQILVYLNLKKLTLKKTFILLFVASLIFNLSKKFWLGQEVFQQLNYRDALSVTYAGGNVDLKAYPIPFNLFQHIRPFFWEAPNIPSLIASFEYLIWFLSFVVLLCKNSNLRIHLRLLLKNEKLALLFWWTLFHLFAFSFSSNLGDLSRRHIYYYPLLLLLFCPFKQLSYDKNSSPS